MLSGCKYTNFLYYMQSGGESDQMCDQRSMADSALAIREKTGRCVKKSEF